MYSPDESFVNSECVFRVCPVTQWRYSVRNERCWWNRAHLSTKWAWFTGMDSRRHTRLEERRLPFFAISVSRLIAESTHFLSWIRRFECSSNRSTQRIGRESRRSIRWRHCSNSPVVETTPPRSHWIRAVPVQQWRRYVGFCMRLCRWTGFVDITLSNVVIHEVSRDIDMRTVASGTQDLFEQVPLGFALSTSKSKVNRYISWATLGWLIGELSHVNCWGSLL